MLCFQNRKWCGCLENVATLALAASYPMRRQLERQVVETNLPPAPQAIQSTYCAWPFLRFWYRWATTSSSLLALATREWSKKGPSTSYPPFRTLSSFCRSRMSFWRNCIWINEGTANRTATTYTQPHLYTDDCPLILNRLVFPSLFSILRAQEFTGFGVCFASGCTLALSSPVNRVINWVGKW